MTTSTPTFIAFAGSQRIAHGPIDAVARAVHAHQAGQDLARKPDLVLIFDAAASALVDLDLRGDADAAAARALARFAPPAEEARGRGRPKLGVEAREVTLLPRHWEWLASQPGGASVALRKLVEVARRSSEVKDRVRQAGAVAYRFMSTMAGHEPGFEEASRALFAGDQAGFEALIAAWPVDVQNHLKALATDAFWA